MDETMSRAGTELEQITGRHDDNKDKSYINKGFIGHILDIFSSIWTGVALLTILFIYSSVGSALPVVRQSRFFEMTEFEWFHWWPFDLCMGLLFLTMLCVTLRKVRLTKLTAGTWCAHVGILVLGLGSWIYFGSKVEGDAPVVRRAVEIRLPGAEPVQLVALPGAQTDVHHNGRHYTFAISSINPDWPILSGEDKGKKAYSVNVAVSGGDQEFVRQLLDGYDEYTEDIIPGKGRAVKSTGKKLVDESLSMRLTYAPQDTFFLADSRALYVRQAGSREWSMRPMEALPRYNDYVADLDSVWGAQKLAAHDLNLKLDASDSGDLLADVAVTVNSYLRYARGQTGYVDNGDEVNPLAEVRIESDRGEVLATDTLLAFDPARQMSQDGLVRFHWVENEADLAELTVSRIGRLKIEVPANNVNLDIELTETVQDNPDLDFTEILGTDYAYRVKFISDNLQIRPDKFVSLAVVEIRRGQETFVRWVADDPSVIRDMPSEQGGHQEVLELDEGIVMAYEPGKQAAMVTLAAGPNETLGVQFLIRRASGEVSRHPVQTGQQVALADGFTLKLVRYLERARREVRPAIVPREQRERNAGNGYSMVEVTVGPVLVGADTGVTKWVPYQPYVFANNQYSYARLFQVRPVLFELADGRKIEVVFSRARRALPKPVILEDFKLTAHVGGFTGSTASIRDWTSMVRFQDESKWGQTSSISVNAPVENGGFWYFQSYWDAPLSGRSAGFNFTGLGVGNRNGVMIQLIGCIISVAGMVYAFYVKAILRRRKKGALVKVHETAEPNETLDAAQGGRFKAVVGLCVGLGVLYCVYLYGSQDRGRSDLAEPTAFAEQVDLSPLTQMAVQTDGRLKSFDSYAHEMMRYVSGPHKIHGQNAMLSFLDLMLRPRDYHEAEILYVKNKNVRRQIADVATGQLGRSDDWARRFMKRGLITPVLLHDRSVQALLERLSSDLVRTAKFVEEIRSAQTVMRSDFLANKLSVVPPVEADLQSQWFTLEAVSGGSVAPQDATHAGMNSGAAAKAAGLSDEQADKLSSIWSLFKQGWVSQEAAVVSAAAKELAAFLPTLAPEIYPSRERLKWEGWYFQKRNLTWVWVIYMFSVLFLLMSVVYKWGAARWLGLGIFVLAFGLHTVALLLRWYVAGRWPNSNMFEAVTTAAWFGGCAALVFEIWGRKSEMRNLFALCSACASMAALMAVHFLPLQLNPAIGNMMPVLHDIWLYIHTNVIIFSYCLIGMAAVTGTLYLLWRVSGGGLAHARAGGAGMLLEAGREKASRGSIGRMFDGATMVLMELSFVLLWSGIVMGAIWADHSWGRPWGWDPKEVFALNTFIVFILLIHVRIKVADKGFWTAILAVAGCGVMLFNWIVINFVISGLHSYA